MKKLFAQHANVKTTLDENNVNRDSRWSLGHEFENLRKWINNLNKQMWLTKITLIKTKDLGKRTDLKETIPFVKIK